MICFFNIEALKRNCQLGGVEKVLVVAYTQASKIISAITKLRGFIMTEQKVVYEIKVSKPLMVFLWAMGVGLLMNLPIGNLIVPNAYAELSNNPTITLILKEGYSSNVDLDD